jgi:hypothetical protein
MHEPVLKEPFLPELADAADPNFPVRITKRAARKLFWHIAGMEPYLGPALRITTLGGKRDPAAEYCDHADIDPETHVVSEFGRVSVGVPLEEFEEMQGYVLDMRSFPPGPIRLYLKKEIPEQTEVPARLRLDLETLGCVQPELFQVPGLFSRGLAGLLRITSNFSSGLAPKGWIGRLLGVYDPDGQAEAIETLAMRFWNFHVEPALVLSESPCKVAAYSSTTDGVMMLRLDEKSQTVLDFLGGEPWVGQRLMVIFGYDQTNNPSGDLACGPYAISTVNEAWPVLVDWLVSDKNALDQARKTIQPHFWDRCRLLGEKKLAQEAPCRDARPWYSRISTQAQKYGGEWTVRGRYWT